MPSVAVVPHALRPQAVDLATEAVGWLVSRGHEVRVPAEDASFPALAPFAWPADELVPGLDLALSLGGDGTVLRAVHLVAGSGVPVLGVNVGRLGYLTEVEPAALRDALERFFAGDFEMERRMTLQVDVQRAGGGVGTTALNEAVLEKTKSGHIVRMGVSVNGEPFTTYGADGLIVSTPTGSTAYNLSARGPIVSPRHRALVVTPVSPHMLFDRSLILGDDESVQVEVLDGVSASLVVDGRTLATLEPGDAAACRAAAHDACFVRYADRDFHQILKAKFGLADR